MDDHDSLGSMDSLLLQLALQTREISQKRDQINQQIQIGKANVAEKKSYIKGIQRNIRKLEEECHHKQNIVKHLKGNTKSLKGANSLLLQYEKTLQAELKRRRDNCNQDMKVYQERIERYRKVFQKHKESYWQNPLAKQLLMIQSEKEELESRIKACEDQITAKEKALQDLRGQTLSIENPLESISGLLTAAESHRQSASQAEDDHQSPLDISSLHLSQDGHEKQGEGIEEHLEKTFAHPPSQGDTHCDMWSYPEAMDEMHASDQEEGSVLEEQLECLNTSNTVEMEEVKEVKEVKERGTEGGEEQPTSFITEEEENEGMGAAFSPQTPARMKAVSSTPTFSLNISSSHPDGSTVKSPAFLFSMSSAPSPLDFSGFDCGFELGSAQEEEPPFPFTSSYFSSEKKPSGSKSPPGFLFARPESEKSEDGFEFPFSSKSPGQPSASREKGPGAGDSFPFSFNF
ncbi:uncharacterized protein LOC121537097 isoform X3 [Coregonus clupeaformis]|uniref:uncharacterized protein LOC121537097 isoform X3 n=1 Tax=Coregonus clupeaformis TaxID=59861 RepID=UPI001BDFE272|nr:uncharacterized protein LOC121537097 isoform X3 [Coregonus clupeaformis]